MRSYLAILKDSFREALASRVMLVTLIGIVAVLAVLVPFGLKSTTATTLRHSELRRPERLLAQLAAGSDADQQLTPPAHLWSLFTVKQQEELSKLLDPESDVRDSRRRPGPSPQKRKLLTQLNKLLDNPKFHDEDAWANSRLDDETKTLLNQSSLDDDELKRRNLLLLAAAFPGAIDIVDSNAISLTWGTADVLGPFPITPTQFDPLFNEIVVSVVGVFLGFFGVFGCLLVTAGLIPRTFEPGEIALLLSKPVSRSVLFVVKFFGGCVFTLIYASVLVVGIWLLLGLRMNSWRTELFWCIPVYVFLFMIYYSVSAVSGAIWRNAIVALALVVVFWIGLTVVGVTQEALKADLIRERGIREIVPAGAQLITVDGEQNTWVWEDDASAWKQVFNEPPGGMGPLARMFAGPSVRFVPVYDAHNDRILALAQTPSRFGGLGSSELISGSVDDDWERIPMGRVPDFVPTILMSREGRIILPAVDAIYEYVGQSESDQERVSFLGKLSGGLLGQSRNGFRQLEPTDMPDLGGGFSAAIDPLSDTIVLYGDGQLYRLAVAEDGKYELARSREFDTEENGVIASGGDFVILGLSDGTVRVLHSANLETVDEMQLPDGVLPRVCVAAGEGSSLALLTHDDSVVVFDAESKKLRTWSQPRGSVSSAIAYSADNRLMVADGRLKVAEYTVDGSSGDVAAEWAEPTTWIYQFYDYAVLPVWTVLPKPSQLDQFVTYIMSGNKSMIVNPANGPGMMLRNNLDEDRDTFDPWPVIRDNAVFVIVMLAIGCVYISRRDF